MSSVPPSLELEEDVSCRARADRIVRYLCCFLNLSIYLQARRGTSSFPSNLPPKPLPSFQAKLTSLSFLPSLPSSTSFKHRSSPSRNLSSSTLLELVVRSHFPSFRLCPLRRTNGSNGRADLSTFEQPTSDVTVPTPPTFKPTVTLDHAGSIGRDFAVTMVRLFFSPPTPTQPLSLLPSRSRTFPLPLFSPPFVRSFVRSFVLPSFEKNADRLPSPNPRHNQQRVRVSRS